MRYACDTGPEVELTSEDNLGGESSEANKIGYVFYYPELGQCKVIEADPDRSETQRTELKQFEEWVCKILYVINERKHLK